MKVRVYGPGCAKCTALAENVEKAAAQSGLTCEIEKVKGLNEIITAGVINTPGLEINGQIVMQGKVLSMNQLISILADHDG